jgi:ABC-type transport system involved in multi-copper enzyme maturation permease subunit
MIAAIKSEFRKLLTVRSTYILTALAAAIVIFVAFYVEGWNLRGVELNNPLQLASDIYGSMTLMIFGGIVALLSMTHEYRYNIINHSLTASNSRGKVLVAKFVVISLYGIFLTVLIAVLSPLMSYLGVAAHGNTLAPQTFDWSNLIWIPLFYGWGITMAGLVLALLIRNQIASFVAIFVIPSVVENFIGFLLLKHNAVYMPFTALSHTIQSQMGVATNTPISSTMSAGHAALIYTGYLVAAWVAGWILFHRRDAN